MWCKQMAVCTRLENANLTHQSVVYTCTTSTAEHTASAQTIPMKHGLLRVPMEWAIIIVSAGSSLSWSEVEIGVSAEIKVPYTGTMPIHLRTGCQHVQALIRYTSRVYAKHLSSDRTIRRNATIDLSMPSMHLSTTTRNGYVSPTRDVSSDVHHTYEHSRRQLPLSKPKSAARGAVFSSCSPLSALAVSPALSLALSLEEITCLTARGSQSMGTWREGGIVKTIRASEIFDPADSDVFLD